MKTIEEINIDFTNKCALLGSLIIQLESQTAKLNQEIDKIKLEIAALGEEAVQRAEFDKKITEELIKKENKIAAETGSFPDYKDQ
jgi:hypothetical protein